MITKKIAQYERANNEAYFTYLLPMSAAGGTLSGFSSEGTRLSDCERVVSPIAEVDFAITVYGDSMSPDYPSGSRILIKKIDPSAYIAWGNVFVLDTVNGVILKEVQPSEEEGRIVCHSLNPSGRFKDFEISMKDDTALMPLGVKVLPSQWDEKAQKVVSHPAKDALNAFIRNRMVAVLNLILSLTTAGELVSLSATQVKNKVASLLDPEVEKENLFVSWFEKHIARQENRRTREIYQATLKKLQSYDRMIGKLSFEEIGKAWLTDFDTWLAENGCPGRNSRNIHLRNIRAVFNEAIDNEVTMAYPFRKFKIKPEQTAKRNLSVGSLRQLFDYPVEDWQRRYVDFFKLTFFLIGINTVDLLACRPSDLTEGRLRYKRAKTGRIYNIKVEPEAADLIGQYHGNDLLVSFGEGITNYHNFTGKCDKGLKSIGTVEQVENPKWKEGSRKHRYVTKRNSAFPGLSIYWARHSWATIAASLDIPKETIAAALGHGGNTVTDIYIDFDQKKVDDANRKVIDWVLYGKR